MYPSREGWTRPGLNGVYRHVVICAFLDVLSPTSELKAGSVRPVSFTGLLRCPAILGMIDEGSLKTGMAQNTYLEGKCHS